MALPEIEGINPIVMPKWGLAMQEGMVAAWNVDEGATIAKGQEIMDIETSKIANVFESPADGVLRRRVAGEGETLPVGALLGVIAAENIADDQIDNYVKDFQDNFVPEVDEEGGGPEPEFVDVGDRRVRYVKQGEGEGTPILFIHGFGGDYLSWMFNQPSLAESTTTYALELPGHGGSSKDVGEGTVGFMTEIVMGFMDQVGIPRTHLVGHSLGGAIALDLAAKHSDRAASVTMICPAGLGHDINMTFIDGFIAEKRGKKLRPMLEMLVADPSLVTREMVDEVLKYKRLDGVDAALKSLSAACFPEGKQATILRDALEPAPCPVQIIWGEEDQIVPSHHSDNLSNAVSITRIADAGHIVQMEKSSDVNALIEEFTQV